MYLVNDKSIAPAAMDGDQAIEYFHIELDTDEVIFAGDSRHYRSMAGARRSIFRPSSNKCV
jgi:hypothetical protein